MFEVMFFLVWFWSFFKYVMYLMGLDSFVIDGMFLFVGIEIFDFWYLLLINILILLCFGCVVIWVYYVIVYENNCKDLVNGLIIVIVLGVVFIVL